MTSLPHPFYAEGWSRGGGPRGGQRVRGAGQGSARQRAGGGLGVLELVLDWGSLSRG